MNYPDEGIIESPRKLIHRTGLKPKLVKGQAPSDKFDSGPSNDHTNGVTEGAEPNLATSLCEDGFHRPCLDWDHPMSSPEKTKRLLLHILGPFLEEEGLVRTDFTLDTSHIIVVQSTNNWHVYIPAVKLSWDSYVLMLWMLCNYGLIEQGYYDWSLRRGYSALRLQRTQETAVYLTHPFRSIADLSGSIEIATDSVDKFNKIVLSDEPTKDFLRRTGAKI